MNKTTKHYIYRMDHDTGFAPNTERNLCTLSGCKNVIERCAEKGSWIIGIGGNRTGKPNKLIYAMKVQEKLPAAEFRKKYPKRYEEWYPKMKNVLISRKFHYFGEKAIDLPARLKHIIIKAQGYKCVSDGDISKLEKHLANRKGGVRGQPNNLEIEKPRSCPRKKKRNCKPQRKNCR